MALAVVDEILDLKKRLDVREEVEEGSKKLIFPLEVECLDVLAILRGIPIDKAVLARTRIGVSVGRLRQHEARKVAEEAASLVATWKTQINDKRPTASSGAGAAPGLPPSSSGDLMDDTSVGGDQGACVSPAARTTAERYPGPTVRDEKRNKAREVLWKAALEGVPDDQRGHLEPEKVANVIAETEETLWLVSGGEAKKSYNLQLRALKTNLSDRKNPEFNFKVAMGFFAVTDLAKMSSVEMASDSKKRERLRTRKDALEACQSDWDVRNVKRAAGQFPCGKCKSQNTTYFQMQTRSSDEPMTTFVHCLECSNRWKF